MQYLTKDKTQHALHYTIGIECFVVFLKRVNGERGTVN